MEIVSNGEIKHLHPSVIKYLHLPKEERIKTIRSEVWIGYTKANEALRKMEILLNYPQKDRMPNLLLVGDPNNGKTTIINRFHRNHPSLTDEETGRMALPVFVVQAPSVPDENRFLNIILNKLYAPYKERERPDKKLFQAMKIFERLKTRLIILDEFHNILAGSPTKQRQFLNALKYLCNELKISIVGVGTKDAFNVINTDPQMSSRFEPFVLPLWKMNDDYLRLLMSFERMIPLKQPSNLVETTMANKILGMSEGLLGEIATILVESAVLAVEKGEERISLQLLQKLKFITPSQRKNVKI